MTGFRTRGQPAATSRLSAMVTAGLPHALLLAGPASVGKTTLALDLAAAQLCLAPDPAARPCRECRGCRLVERGQHPDIMWLYPQGPANQIIIGDARNPEPGSIRYLLPRLALLASEGGARIVIAESAHRMNPDAQHALLKTLEEPSAGVTLILCAEDEDRLLPTIHSRVVRIRLGTLAPRAIEALLEERGEADAPTAGLLARLAGGRPGLALAYARSPEAVAIRGEIARSLLDLAGARPAVRLARIRELLARAAELADALAPGSGNGRTPGRTARGRRARAVEAATAEGGVAAGGEASGEQAPPDEVGGPTGPGAGGRATPAERRRAASTLLEVWRDLARDLALLEVGDRARLNDPDLLEELEALRRGMLSGSGAQFLVRLDRASQLLDANANPELTADVLALAWPRTARAA